ncbi:LrgB-like family-domain-containing protein [Limtongia smithiae]|uniref:LrgB-like family-domain-containing protein n=1 Tax=Limtongia smithiae TaxID=1125753 RepID=UPI0034CFF407
MTTTTPAALLSGAVRSGAVDLYNALSVTLKQNTNRLFRSFVLVPAGTFLMLLFLYGIHAAISLTPVNFPASVICMILLFLFLLLVDITLGSRRAAALTRIIDVPLGFYLRWINTFFTPSFVRLPLSPAVGGAEVGKIAAVFILGFVVTMALTAYMVLFLQKAFNVTKRAMTERADELPPPLSPALSASHASAHGHRHHMRSSSDDSTGEEFTESIELDILRNASSSTHSQAHILAPERAVERPLRTREVASMQQQDLEEIIMNREIDMDLASMADASSTHSLGPVPTRMSFTATRNSHDVQGMRHIRRVLTGEIAPSEESPRREKSEAAVGETDDDASPVPIAPVTSHASTVSAVSSDEEIPESEGYFLIGTPSLRSQWFAAKFTQYLDTTIYTIVFLCVGLPLYFVINFSLVAHGTFTVLMLFFGLRLPLKVRRFMHPIFTCSGFTILGIYVMAVAHRQTLDDGLNAYSTGKTYLYLFGENEYSQYTPGAGDVLRSLLDVSIVALALPMYRYRGDLRKHFSIIIIPNVVTALVTFFAYPPVCYAIGISAERSIAFIGRSVTLALALPVVTALGGSQSLVAVVAILSGIIGVLIGGYILAALRVREEDYLTRGITLGINSSAVATAHLLTIDPRASALSSLSFVLFGTTLIILSAITPIVNIIRSMVGL